jgi:uncharacterized membrane protein
LAAVLFDLMGWILKRDSLVWAGIWTLWAGVVGGWSAVILGELAEEKIDHGEAIHEIMSTHEKLALITMSVFTVVLAWKLWRRFQLRPLEARLLNVLAGVGFVFLLATGAEGGEMVFGHAAGIPTAKLQAEIENREAGHQHEPGEADHDHDAADTTQDSTPHTHVDPPGTPPHKH